MTAGQWTMAGQNWVLTRQILGFPDMFLRSFTHSKKFNF